jgi:beta-mannosidase
MKNTLIQIFFLTFVVLLVSCKQETIPTFQKVELNSSWVFSRKDNPEWLPASVPGTVHTDLLNNGTISNPFYGCNEYELQWVGEKDWIYKTTFNVDSATFLNPKIFLIFEGIDTYADVFLNGKELLHANNMHRKWEAECREILKANDNILEVHFQSALNKFFEDSIALGYPLPGGRWVLARKAAYHFGWDWGPRFITAGIYKPVYLEVRNCFKAIDIHLFTKDISNDKALLSVTTHILSDIEDKASIKVIDKKNSKVLIKQVIPIARGQNDFSIDFTINNPQLWWCNGLGEPNVYDLIVKVETEKDYCYTKEIPFGIRTLQTIMEDDEHGKSLYVMLNGVPVFMKGANYIPQHSFVSEVTDQQYQDIIKMAVESNMNMLRVWGGGVYEKDIFYELCNRNGILVWQDFMFACAMYPGNDEFVENVKQEAIYQVKRLRNYSNIALWCGNNEIDEGWHNWGWQKVHSISQKDSATIWEGYKRVFHGVLPEVVSTYDPQRFYLHTSPLHGWGREESMMAGSSHYWGVWWGVQPFEMYLEKVPRFMSEYGFQAMPTISTVREFQSEDDDFIFSESLKCHQKHLTGYETISTYLERENLYPESLQDFIYQSQLIQAKGIGLAIEAHRRAKPRCMGTLYWQLNDCWPVVSWSGTDAYGNWKALQYKARKLYDDIMVSIIDYKDVLEIFVVSDRQSETQGSIEINLIDFSGNRTNVISSELTLAANTSQGVFSKKSSELFAEINTKTTLIECIFRTKDKKLYANEKFIEPYGNLHLPSVEISTRIEPVTNGFNIHLKANAFAAHVQLYLTENHAWFNDNFFHLFPQMEHVVFCRSDLGFDEFSRQLGIHHLAIKTENNKNQYNE